MNIEKHLNTPESQSNKEKQNNLDFSSSDKLFSQLKNPTNIPKKVFKDIFLILRKILDKKFKKIKNKLSFIFLI